MRGHDGSPSSSADKTLVHTRAGQYRPGRLACTVQRQHGMGAVLAGEDKKNLNTGPKPLQLTLNKHIPPDFVVAQEALDVESSLRLDFLLLHNLRRRFAA